MDDKKYFFLIIVLIVILFIFFKFNLFALIEKNKKYSNSNYLVVSGFATSLKTNKYDIERVDVNEYQGFDYLDFTKDKIYSAGWTWDKNHDTYLFEYILKNNKLIINRKIKLGSKYKAPRPLKVINSDVYCYNIINNDKDVILLKYNIDNNKEQILLTINDCDNTFIWYLGDNYLRYTINHSPFDDVICKINFEGKKIIPLIKGKFYDVRIIPGEDKMFTMEYNRWPQEEAQYLCLYDLKTLEKKIIRELDTGNYVQVDSYKKIAYAQRHFDRFLIPYFVYFDIVLLDLTTGKEEMLFPHAGGGDNIEFIVIDLNKYPSFKPVPENKK